MSKNRITTFDGLRGIAVTVVVLRHCFSMFPGAVVNFPNNLFRYGWLGVDLFFIISGFVIAFTLYKYNNIKNFVIARFARLYPAYWASLLFSALLVYVVHGHINLKQYTANLLMFQDWLHFKDVCGVYWTLVFELAFYVIASTIFYFNLFSKHRAFIAWICIAILWQLSNATGYAHAHSIMSKIGYLLVLQYAQLFIFGIYLYKAFSQGWSKSIVAMLLISSITFILFFPGRETSSMIITKCYLAVLFLICFVATYSPQNRYLSARGLVFLGKISYSWYLTHLMIAEAIAYSFSSIATFTPYISFFLSFGFAIIFNRYIERPSHDFVIRNAFSCGEKRSPESASINT